jgi:hypothetical protein
MSSKASAHADPGSDLGADHVDAETESSLVLEITRPNRLVRASAKSPPAM